MPLTNPPIALQLGLEALQLQVNALQTTVNGLSGFTTAMQNMGSSCCCVAALPHLAMWTFSNCLQAIGPVTLELIQLLPLETARSNLRQFPSIRMVG